MADKNVFEKIKASGHLPKLPQVMVKLIRACNNEKSDTRELTEIISTDPALASKLLEIIGSSYVNLPSDITSIKAAVVYLGLDTIRNLALSSSSIHFFKLTKPLPGFDVTQFWYHSFKCGLIAMELAAKYGLADQDEFFLAGLLHDIGRLMLIQAFPDEYTAIIAKAANEEETLEAEMQAFGADTPQISAWFFRKWNLNPLISGAVLFINEPAAKIQGELDQLKIIYLANRLSGGPGREELAELSDLGTLPASDLENIVAEAEKKTAAMAMDLGLELKPHRDAVVGDSVAEKDISRQVQDVSLFYGTLENLLNAQDLKAVKDTIQNGLKIMFQAQRLFFFFPDQKRNLLIGDTCSGDKLCKIIKSIALPMSNRTSLLVRSVKTRAILSSFEVKDRKVQAISDTQIIRLLETKGFYSIPVISRDRVLCLMVVGVNRAGQIDTDSGLLDLLSRQIGVCMENILFHQEYALRISEKKMEAYAALTDRVVHEINNPIAIIKNYLETLMMKLPDKHPAQEELAMAGEEMSRVSSLVEELSSFAKPKIGGFEYIDVNQLLTRTFELLKKSIFLPRRIEGDMVADPELPRMKTDRNALKQVLINLLKNSAEAMADGGKIEVRTRLLSESGKIMIDEKKKVPGQMELRITDNGPGIPSHIMEKLFEPYTTSKSAKTNSGLGLAIVHSIVKELGGSISCESKPGKGTRFSILLPVSPDNRES